MKTNLIILGAVAIIVIGGVVFFANQNIAPTDEGTPITTGTNDEPLPVSDSNDSTPTQGNTQNTNTDEPKAQGFTMAQVATHSNISSCWTAVRGKVYDLTSWIPQHPGGPDKILKLCGKDGTETFVGQHGGSAQQETQLAKFYIGDLIQ
ncbi:MAG: cytochrome b5-like heme/steroid binding domain-containing protein [Patescibacteria group bacterium]|nr:cytochrome b5-like heme/steroid binding domain-containing protein [bacterium]MDZ4240838.1 cytochrome b5-like heme/steroid binding domain-containing protein [Patescibacteria group bacterium]